jgi:hypothetical protein
MNCVNSYSRRIKIFDSYLTHLLLNYFESKQKLISHEMYPLLLLNELSVTAPKKSVEYMTSFNN